MNAPAESVQFLLDGKAVAVAGLPATATLLQYLREFAGRTGTKEGCAEGDCGACTVVIGELAGDAIRYRAVNSCIRFLPTLDGKEVVTVESLQDDDGSLHPVQQALIDCDASQCGFCTPGFAMSLLGLYLNAAADGRTPRREELVDALAGNLCRCTGYRPIIDAGLRMFSYPQSRRWPPDASQSTKKISALRAIRRETPLQLPGFQAPRTLEQLAAALLERPEALILAGGTDVGLWVTKHLRDLPAIIYLGEVAELQAIRKTESAIEIGAAVPLSAAWAALVAAHPALAELAQRFASPPVCNSGTLCGNLANGSPIGDSMPALIVLGAEIELRRGADSRRLPLEAFYLGYQKKDLWPGEFVVGVRVPHAKPGLQLACYKLAKRIDQDISAVCAAFSVVIADGDIAAARIAFGGMAAVPARARKTEAALIGQPWTAAGIEPAIAALAQDFRPLTDMRASGAYRLRGAGNLLRRFYLEHAQDSGAGRPHLRTHEALV